MLKDEKVPNKILDGHLMIKLSKTELPFELIRFKAPRNLFELIKYFLRRKGNR